MAREPTYPDDSPVGDPSGEPERSKDDSEETKPTGSNRTRNIVTGAAIGIGSAALVAALLYANRSRKGGDDDRN